MIVVAGVANLETSIPVGSFPVEYAPVRYPTGQAASRVAGVGANVATALATLGSPVRLAGFVGADPAGAAVRHEVAERHLDGETVVDVPQTPQSVVLVDDAGQRSVFTDLKGLHDASYPVELFDRALDDADLAVLTNIGFCRPLLARARRRDVPVATDVQAIDSLDDSHNAQFMANAAILACSHERLPCPPVTWTHQVLDRYPQCHTVLVGMGDEGCLLTVRDELACHIPAVAPGPVVNTAGAGDALFAAYLHASHTAGHDPGSAAERAVLVAGYAVSAPGEPYLTGQEAEDLHAGMATELRPDPPHEEYGRMANEPPE